jgi:hypothetical protein
MILPRRPFRQRRRPAGWSVKAVAFRNLLIINVFAL